MAKSKSKTSRADALRARLLDFFRESPTASDAEVLKHLDVDEFFLRKYGMHVNTARKKVRADIGKAIRSFKAENPGAKYVKVARHLKGLGFGNAKEIYDSLVKKRDNAPVDSYSVSFEDGSPVVRKRRSKGKSSRSKQKSQQLFEAIDAIKKVAPRAEFADVAFNIRRQGLEITQDDWQDWLESRLSEYADRGEDEKASKKIPNVRIIPEADDSDYEVDSSANELPLVVILERGLMGGVIKRLDLFPQVRAIVTRYDFSDKICGSLFNSLRNSADAGNTDKLKIHLPHDFVSTLVAYAALSDEEVIEYATAVKALGGLTRKLDLAPELSFSPTVEAGTEARNTGQDDQRKKGPIAASDVVDLIKEGNLDIAALQKILEVAYSELLKLGEEGKKVVKTADAAVEDLAEKLDYDLDLSYSPTVGAGIEARNTGQDDQSQKVPIAASDVVDLIRDGNLDIATLQKIREEAGSELLKLGEEGKKVVKTADAALEARKKQEEADAAKYEEMKKLVFGDADPSLAGIRDYLRKVRRKTCETTGWEYKKESVHAINYWKKSRNDWRGFRLYYDKKQCLIKFRKNDSTGSFRLTETGVDGENISIKNPTRLPSLLVKQRKRQAEAEKTSRR